MQIRWSGGHIHHWHTMSNYIYEKTYIKNDENVALNTSFERGEFQNNQWNLFHTYLVMLCSHIGFMQIRKVAFRT